MKLLELAVKIAKIEHKDDRYGEKDYFEYHLMNVYRRVEARLIELGKEVEEKFLVVALFHDLHEDHEYSLKKIELLFGAEIAAAVEAMSFKKDEESREEYYERVLENEIAVIVKYADACENMFNCEVDGDKPERVAYYKKIVEMMK